MTVEEKIEDINFELYSLQKRSELELMAWAHCSSGNDPERNEQLEKSQSKIATINSKIASLAARRGELLAQAEEH